MAPAELFSAWLDWMSDTVLSFVTDCKDVPGGPGAVPLARRRIVSLRPRSQEELRNDVKWSQKLREHWTPEREPVFFTIEEPLNGENVARCVRQEGFHAIQAEIQRARDYFARVAGTDQLPPFKALLRLPPAAAKARVPSWSPGAPGKGGGKGAAGFKRPWQQVAAATGGPAHKRPQLGAPGAAAPVQAWNYGALAAMRLRPTQPGMPPPGLRAPFGYRPPGFGVGPRPGLFGAPRPTQPVGAPRPAQPRAPPSPAVLAAARAAGAAAAAKAKADAQQRASGAAAAAAARAQAAVDQRARAKAVLQGKGLGSKGVGANGNGVHR